MTVATPQLLRCDSSCRGFAIVAATMALYQTCVLAAISLTSPTFVTTGSILAIPGDHPAPPPPLRRTRAPLPNPSSATPACRRDGMGLFGAGPRRVGRQHRGNHHHRHRVRAAGASLPRRREVRCDPQGEEAGREGGMSEGRAGRGCSGVLEKGGRGRRVRGVKSTGREGEPLFARLPASQYLKREHTKDPPAAGSVHQVVQVNYQSAARLLRTRGRLLRRDGRCLPLQPPCDEQPSVCLLSHI